MYDPDAPKEFEIGQTVVAKHRPLTGFSYTHCFAKVVRQTKTGRWRLQPVESETVSTVVHHECSITRVIVPTDTPWEKTILASDTGEYNLDGTHVVFYAYDPEKQYDACSDAGD